MNGRQQFHLRAWHHRAFRRRAGRLSRRIEPVIREFDEGNHVLRGLRGCLGKIEDRILAVTEDADPLAGAAGEVTKPRAAPRGATVQDICERRGVLGSMALAGAVAKKQQGDEKITRRPNHRLTMSVISLTLPPIWGGRIVLFAPSFRRSTVLGGRP